MSANVDSVRSLWIPLKDMNLLLPNVAVAEVVAYRAPDEVEGGPDWLLGKLSWRGQEVPVVSYEAFCGRSAPVEADLSRITVMNTAQAGSGLPFYALVASGIPRLFQADADGLEETVDGEQAGDSAALSAVRIGSEMAVIPNLDRLQESVASQWSSLAG